MAKQPKAAIKKSSTLSGSNPQEKMSFLKSFKEKNDLTGVKDKDLEWILLPEAFYEAVKCPGIPKGFFSIVRGLPNTGKSTIKLQLIAECQRQGILPVIFETESNFPWEHARMCGVEFEEIYGDVEEEEIDEETGEVTTKTVRKVVDHEGFFLYYDQQILHKKYGKWDYSQGKELSKATRDIAVIEDIPKAINDLLDMQGDEDGQLDYEMCFIWDSVGTLPSYKSVKSNTGNNMFDAAATKQSFATLINNRIPISRKETSKYTNTFFAVNKIWIDNMQMGGPQVKNSGGDGFAYSARFIIHMGGITSPSIEKLKAQSSGNNYYYGIQTKIKVEKNHVNDITYDGKICSVPHGLWSPDKLDDYKKKHSKYLLSRIVEISGGKVKETDDFETSVEPEI